MGVPRKGCALFLFEHRSQPVAIPVLHDEVLLGTRPEIGCLGFVDVPGTALWWLQTQHSIAFVKNSTQMGIGGYPGRRYRLHAD